jgi:DegV family protein with EDD domain
MTQPAFVTDSTSYFPDELREKYSISVAPQVLIWGEETLYDGLDIMPTQFYERLKTAEVMPTTSQVEIRAFKEIYEPLVNEGRPIISILISDKFSGTIQSAEQAKEMFPSGKIEILDSESAAMGMGFQVLAAARAAHDGKSFDEVLETAKNAKDNTGVLLMVDTLEFLHRGGRIGGAARLLGTAVKLKPILELQEGVIETVDKVRTRSKAQARLLDLLEERIAGRTKVRLAVLHAAAEAEAKELLEIASERVNPIEKVFSEVSPVVGAHVGPGTLGLCYSVEL